MKIEDICTRICSGGTPKSGKAEYYENGTIPWLNTKEINFNRIRATETFITEEGLNNSSAKWIKPHAVIVAMYGATAGRVAVAEIPLTTNQACCNLEVDETIADYRYIYYWLKQNYDNIAGLANGGAQQNLSAKVIRQIEINLPDLIKQRSIANFLDRFDSKIETNAKLNGYLEELFAALFSELISSRDYSYVPLTDVIFFQEGPGIRNWQYVYDGDGVNFINIRCIQNHDLDLSKANQISVEEAYGKYDHFLVKPGDILMSSSGTLGRYAIARQEHLPLCMNTSVIRFRPLADSAAYAFVYGYLISREFYNHLTGMANGSAQVNFGPTHLKKIEVPWPDEDVIRTFNKMTMPLIETMNALRSESNKLATLRNTLLPKLMSGEIDVSKVDLTQLNSHLA